MGRPIEQALPRHQGQLVMVSCVGRPFKPALGTAHEGIMNVAALRTGTGMEQLPMVMICEGGPSD